MKREWGKRVLALVLSGMLLMTMTPSKLVLADEVPSTPEEKVTLTVNTAGLQNCNAGISVTQGASEVSESSANSGQYKVNKNTPVTVKATVSVNDSTNYELKDPTTGAGWSRAGNVYTYTYESGLIENSDITLADDLFIQEKVIQGTNLAITSGQHGKVTDNNGNVVSSPTNVKSNTTFLATPEAGYYVANVKVAGQDVVFDSNKVQNDGSYAIEYAYTDGKTADTLEVTFKKVTENAVEELSDFGVTADEYYKNANNEFFVKSSVTLKKEGMTLCTTTAGETEYSFGNTKNIGTSFDGKVYVLDSTAASFEKVILGYSLKVNYDVSAPEIKTINGEVWGPDHKAWIGGNQTSNTVSVKGKVEDTGSGIQSVKYILSETASIDWTSASDAKLDAEGQFTCDIAKSELTNSSTKCFIQALDHMGNEKVVSCAFGRDETAPQITIDTKPRWYNKKKIDVTVKAEDKTGTTETEASGVDKNNFKVFIDDEDQNIEPASISENNGVYSVTIKDVATEDHTIVVQVQDCAGNWASTADDPTHLKYDGEAPTVKNVKAADGTNLTKKGNTFYYTNKNQLAVDFKLEDNIGLQSYTIETVTAGVTLSNSDYVNNTTAKIVHQYISAEASELSYVKNADIKLNLNVTDEESVNVIVCKIKATDLAGNESEIMSLTFEKDMQAPAFTTSQSTIMKNNGEMASLNTENDKYFIDANNKTVTVKTVVKDDKSGVAKIQLLNATGKDEIGTECAVYPSVNASYNDATGEVTFNKVKLHDGDNWFTVVATDGQGNTTGVPSGLYGDDNKAVVYDADAPSVTYEMSRGDTSKKTTWLANPNADATYYYQSLDDLKDTSLQMKISDGQGIQSVVVNAGGSEQTVTINKKSATEWNCTIAGTSVASWLADENGDVTITVTDISENVSTRTIHFVKDEERATIANVKIGDTGIEAINGKVTYSHYFHNNSVTLKADIADGLSGVRNTTYTVTDQNGTKRTGTGDTVSIAAPFKGTVTYTVYDNVNNKTVYQTNGFVVTNGNTSKASLTPAASNITDSFGNPLYGGDTSVAVDVENVYAGIDSITYAVVAPYDVEHNISGTIVPNAEGWKTSYDATGMATKLTGSIPVTNNSNQIAVSVTVRDKAGVEQNYTRTISVDKTAPIISVSYDNNNVDSGNCYRADRTATIVVRERNFNAKDFKLNITNSTGVIPTLSGWTDVADAENPDNNTHFATVSFTADGDYVMDMSYADMTTHAGNAVAAQNFTVDKTAPAISVTFDNNSASNDHYYAQSRTATITVNEHYFDPSRVIVSGTATNDGSTIAFPGIGGWTNNGDVHTASISFTADGDYQFTVNAVDQAGNASPEYVVSEFVVDQTAPTITFGGIEDQASYNDVVEPTVTFEDVNYDSNNVNITLVGANQGQVNYGSGTGDSNNGQTITFGDFERKAEVDDIYTLTATITDMAGNNFEDSITFSVNRFGSNYELDDSLKDIQGKYIKEPIDVVFTETNVNSLADGTSKIVVSTNGTPKTLTAGNDYQVANAGGAGSWSRYTYTIPKNVFEVDGTYIVSVYSEDTAGNINENDAEGKDAEITFGVDATAPVISMTNLENDGNYNATSYDATVQVSDNLVLENVSIQLNGKEVEAKASNDNYTFSIPESSDKQTVTVVATDAAGNSLSQEVSGIVVTTNAFVRFLNNTKAVVGVIVGVVAVGGAGAFVVINGGIGALRFRPKKTKKK